MGFSKGTEENGSVLQSRYLDYFEWSLFLCEVPLRQAVTLVLASNSPRRREILALGGWAFTVLPADVDETTYPGENSRAYVLRMAETKARTVSEKVSPDAFIIGADTTVVDCREDGSEEILGKPENPEQAVSMLSQLSGRTHQVYTAVAVLHRGEAIRSEVCSTGVSMRDYTKAEIATYVASGDPMDKAGAYAIQHKEFHPVASISGCYPNVFGLPLCTIVRLLSAFGVQAPNNITAECQPDIRSTCRVQQLIVA
jgi:septum formation protein